MATSVTRPLPSSTRQPIPHSKLRSSSTSDPFIDPILHSSHRSPPPPPPKAAKSFHRSAMPAPTSKSNNLDIQEAVRETVTVKSLQDSRPRNERSQTTTNSTPNTSQRPANGRSISQDSAPTPDKSKSSTKARGKKGSQHADVIDRLDYTGVGPMFHHDGPFDACAPSRNRQRSKAPMLAWGGRPEELSTPYNTSDSAYPSANVYKNMNPRFEPPKKKVDAIAEAWGIHEPEPYEEFFAGGGRTDGDTPASSIYNEKESHNSHSSRQAPLTKRIDTNGSPSRARANVRRSVVPPPQPIFVPDASEALENFSSSPPTSSPKRSKSLMHRIRKMRDAPNVPVSADLDEPISPNSTNDGATQGEITRPTHRSQNSFLGRFGGGARANQNVLAEKPEPYIYIDAQNNKDLPATPHAAAASGNTGTSPTEGGYFDGSAATGGLGRKTSLMKKVGRVVRGAK